MTGLCYSARACGPACVCVTRRGRAAPPAFVLLGAGVRPRQRLCYSARACGPACVCVTRRGPCGPACDRRCARRGEQRETMHVFHVLAGS